MSDFIVTTDSGADLPIALMKEHDIVPYLMQYELDGKLYTDTMDPGDCHTFYEAMRKGAVPHTSQITTEQFIDFFAPLLEQHKPLIHISLGSRVSGTFHNAELARDELLKDFPDAKMYIIDSTLCSTGYGVLCLKADQLRKEGKTAEETVQWIERYKINMQPWYTTDELKYLRRSGRCSRVSAAIGGMLHICPILNLDSEGHLIVQERVRGLNPTIKRLHKIIASELSDPDPSIADLVNPANQTLYVCHSDVEEKARAFGEGIQKEFGFKDVYYAYIGTIIGANCGPGLMAAFFFGNPRDMKGYTPQK